VRDPDAAKGPYGNEVGEALYQCRLTVSELARRIGISRQDLSEVVNGWRLPSAEQLDLIVNELRWEPDRLYREDFLRAIEGTRTAPSEEPAR
jgi:transcriptional regulator with XRE-family HTH domain